MMALVTVFTRVCVSCVLQFALQPRGSPREAAGSQREREEEVLAFTKKPSNANSSADFGC